MKVGICFFGHVGQASTWKDGIREKEYDVSGINQIEVDLLNPLREILTDFDTSFFVHSWSYDVGQQLASILQPQKLEVEKPRNFFSIRQLKNHFLRSAGWKNPALFTYNLFSSYPKSKKLYWLKRMNAGMSRWYSTRRSLELLEEYEKENDFKFDHIISIRLDFIFKRNCSSNEMISPNVLTLANFNKTPSLLEKPDFGNNTFNKNKCSDLFFSGPRDRILRLKTISLMPHKFAISPHKSSFEVLFKDPKDYRNVEFHLYPWIDFGTFKSEYAGWKIDK